MDYARPISIISALTALVATVAGPFVTLAVAMRQFNERRKVASSLT